MNIFRMSCAILTLASPVQEIIETPSGMPIEGGIMVDLAPSPETIGVCSIAPPASSIIIATDICRIGGDPAPAPSPPSIPSPANPNPVPICMNFYKCLVGVMIGVILVLINWSFGKTIVEQPIIFLFLMGFVYIATIVIGFLWYCFCKSCRMGGCPLLMGVGIGITLMLTDWSFLPHLEPGICLLLVACAYVSTIILGLLWYCSSARISI